MKTVLLPIIGFIFLVLGAVGLAVPIWPTTPFVLVAAGCFSATPRLRRQLLRLPFFREHIENYAARQGLRRKTVAISLGYLWGMMLLSMLVIGQTWAYILLPLIGAAVTIHILYMAKPAPNRPPQEQNP